MSRSMQPSAYVKRVKETFLFRGLSEEAVAGLILRDGVTIAHYAKDETLLNRDNRERMLGLILFGSCVVVKEQENGRIPMSVLEAGDLFGAASLFRGDAPYVAHVTAAESTWAMLITEDALKEMMQERFEVAENFMTYLAARIRFLSERIDSFVPQGAEERVYAYMKRNARDGVYRPAGSVSAFAEALCMSRATLYRALGALEESGRVKRNGKAFEMK